MLRRIAVVADAPMIMPATRKDVKAGLSAPLEDSNNFERTTPLVNNSGPFTTV
jgi:hypothetical protein